jgi:2-polyprenyl-3-methyl-5-hydroxy-6-metoxy-1,4-benzoquinol methylase
MSDFDRSAFEKLRDKVLADLAGAMGAFMAFIGDQTGVYKALERRGRCRADELAALAGVDPRYLLEWLSSNAANGYVDYHPEDETFSLSKEQAAIFAVDGTTRSLQGFVHAFMGQVAAYEQAIEVFRSGSGRPWGAHCQCCYCATDRGFRPIYEENLVSNWIPSLNGVEAKLASGGEIADIGCGHGSSSLLLAKAFPSSAVHGFDVHAPSIAVASRLASEAGATNAEFEVASAKAFPGEGYDLVCVFDALHDMGDPVGVARHVRGALKDDGVFMVVEQIAADRLEDNLSSLAALVYGFSTTICLPVSRSQEVGLCLGAQAGERRLTQVLREAGFTQVRRAASSEANMVLEARR